MIHPSAIIHPKAMVDSTVVVGPGVVIDEGVRVGPHCVIGPYAYLTGLTTIGSNNIFHSGCVIGGAPQDLKYRGEPTKLRVGDYNVVREHFTLNRSTSPDGETVIGSHNLLMNGGHVAHDCILGNHIIMGGGAMLAGHVEVQDNALISGNCLLHQFTRVGRLAMMQGGSAISKDLPPFTMARGVNSICGLNIVGLRRAGFKPAERLELKRLYHALFRSNQLLRIATASARATFSGTAALVILDFIDASKRGVCFDKGGRRTSHDEEEEATANDT